MTLNAIPGGEGCPPEPDWSQVYTDVLDLSAAHEHWGMVVQAMQGAQTLSPENGHMIERLVRSRIEYERAARDVADNGTVLKARRTKVPQVNPYWSIMRQASDDIRLIEIELGIPPVRRGKAAKVQRGAKAPRAADAFLKKVSG